MVVIIAASSIDAATGAPAITIGAINNAVQGAVQSARENAFRSRNRACVPIYRQAKQRYR
jgi:hypothetical protein